MFEDDYRLEMNRVHASESLIASTLESVQREQLRLQEMQGADAAEESAGPTNTREPEPVSRTVTASRSRSRILWIGLPVAASIVFLLVGVFTVPQLVGTFGQNAQQSYEFHLVQGGSSLTSGLQFGSIDGQSGSALPDLRRAECLESLLPEGILQATPVTLGGYDVYLGFDEQQAAYYAAYRKDNAGETWVVLQSTNLDEGGFSRALENYFSQ